MAIKLWSCFLSFLYTSILYGVFKVNYNVMALFNEVSIIIPQSAYYVVSVHWSVFFIMGIFGTFLLIYKDWIYSERVVVKINWIVTIIIIAVPYMYGAIIFEILNLLPP
ncbi:MAG TPA: hypothetical protein EYP59_18600 [Thiotrichaceae bacterium]|nr:hypothetical protein [Thiotrichaceae bacterium]